MERLLQNTIARAVDFTRPVGPQIDMLADKYDIERKEVVAALDANGMYNPKIDNDRLPNADYTEQKGIVRNGAVLKSYKPDAEKKNGRAGNNNGKAPRWTAGDVERLIDLLSQGLEADEISDRLGRSRGSITGKRHELWAKGLIPDEVITNGKKKPRRKKSKAEVKVSPAETVKDENKNAVAPIVTVASSPLPLFGDIVGGLGNMFVVSETRDYESDVQYYLLRAASGNINLNVTVESV